jgi:HAMP domain-containing protein
VLNRLSANALLKSVIAAMAVVVVFMLAGNAWNAWQKLATTGRILSAAEVSGFAFKAMNNLRTDRSTTSRGLNGAEPAEADLMTYLKPLRDGEMPALKLVADLVPTIEFADKQSLVPEIQRAVKTLTALQAESWEALGKPKAARREQLAKEHFTEETGLLSTLEKLSSRLFAAVKHSDTFVDQMLEMKQLAWAMRNSAGEASLLVSNGLTAGRLPPEARLKYAGFLGGADVAWAALEDMGFGTTLPPRLAEAIAGAKKAYFEPAYIATRDRLLDTLIAGEKPEMTATQWSPYTVGRLSTVLTVAEAALNAAKDYAEAQRGAAQRELATQLGLLVAALALAAGSMIAVSRRVINPLRAIQDAMLKVAAGDLAVEAPFAERRDEIGALAGALVTFRQNSA